MSDRSPSRKRYPPGFGGGTGVRLRRWLSKPLNLVAFLVVWVALLAAFFGYVRIGAPGVPVVVVTAAAIAVTAVGLWVAAPDVYEIRAVRLMAVELLTAGVMIVLAYRVILAFIEVGTQPNRGYPLWGWMLAALVFETAKLAASAAIVSRVSLGRVREVMAAFAITGLGFAVAAEATRVLDAGYTAGRWGLVPVWAAFAFYPVWALPFHALTSAILGWGWALTSRSRNPAYVLAALSGVAVLVGTFGYAVVRDPFSGFVALVVALGAWLWLFVAHPDRGRMVARLPGTSTSRVTDHA